MVKITPSIITLDLERTLQKTVPVRPRLLGRPAAGYEVAEVASEPAEVRIAGPKSRVQEVESAFTEPVSVEGAGATVVESVNIGLEDPRAAHPGQPAGEGHRAHPRGARDARSLTGWRWRCAGARPRAPGAGAGRPEPGPPPSLGRVQPGEVRAYVDARGCRGTAPVAVELAPARPGYR